MVIAGAPSDFVSCVSEPSLRSDPASGVSSVSVSVSVELPQLDIDVTPHPSADDLDARRAR